MAAGYTISLPENDSVHMTKQKLLDNIAGLLGGRAAEKVALDDICTGATNDIERATELARRMVMEFGMSDMLGPMTFGTGSQEVFIGRDFGRARNYSEEVAAAIDKEVRQIIEDAFLRAQQILTENKAALERVTEVLLQKETLTGKEFKEIFEGFNQPPKDEKEESEEQENKDNEK